MTQPTFWQKIRRSTAALVGALFLFTTVTTPVVEANFWEQRRDASRRVSGKSQGSPALMAGMSGSFGANDSVLPAVNGAFGSALPSVSSADLKGVPSAMDVRASALPTWLRGLPNSAGEIRDVVLAKNADKAPVVVLIQDVHNVFSAQKNIAQIVSHIDSAAARDNRGPVLIGLEGGVGAFDIARFRASRGRAGHALATELLLKTNLIAGPEFYAFQAEKEPLLWGVESREDYIENAEAVRAGHPVAERVAAAIASAEVAVEKRAEAVFSPELKDLNRILAAHNRGDSSIVDLVRVLKAHAPKALVPEVDKLQKALDMEKGLDFAQVERERKALIEVLVRVLDASSIEKLTAASLSYRAGQMNFGTYHAQLKALVKSHGIRWSEYGEFDKYVQYVLLSESIDKFRLFDQIEDLKGRAVANLGRSQEEKKLMGLAEDLRLVHRLVRHEFGPAEWKSYQERKTDLARLNARLAESLGADAVAGVSAQDLAPFERFYVAADRRNDSLAANLMAKGKDVDAQVMVLVAGGYHTAELESRIKAKGYSVVTLTPAIGEIPTDLNYLDIFTVKNIPLEQFLQGEKLYLSPPRELSLGASGLSPNNPANVVEAGNIFSAAAAAIEEVSGVESSGPAIAGVTAKVESNGVVVTATAEAGPAVQAWPTDQTPQNGSATGVAVSGVVNGQGLTVALLTGNSAQRRERSFRDILGDWFESLMGFYQPSIVPKEKGSVGSSDRGPFQGAERTFLSPLRVIVEYLKEFRRVLYSRFEKPVDMSKPIPVSTKRLKYEGKPAEIPLSFGSLSEGMTFYHRYHSGSLILVNRDNGEEIEIMPVAQERPVNVAGQKEPVPTIQIGLKIGDYVYVAKQDGTIDLEDGWVGNLSLLRFLGKDEKNLSERYTDPRGVWEDDRYLYGRLFNDPPSPTVGDKWTPEIPSKLEIDNATKFFDQLSDMDNGTWRIPNRIRYLHHLSVLVRVRTGKGISSKMVLDSRLMATAALRKAAMGEGFNGPLAGLIERIMWSSGILAVQGRGVESTDSQRVSEEDQDQFDRKIPFKIETPEDFDRLADVAKGLVRNGSFPTTFLCTIKNFAPGNYLAYLSALENVSNSFGGKMTFLLSVEKPETLKHDLPGATTALRRVGDVFGEDFFKERNFALITDAGSKTRGAGITNAHHGNFSWAPIMRIRSGNRLDVSTFLEINLESILVAWLLMEGHGRSTFVWAASDGIIRFGVRPGFGPHGLDELPKRFIAASGPGVQLFSPDVARDIVHFSKRHKVTPKSLFEKAAPPMVQAEFDGMFGVAVETAKRTFDHEKLGDKGNFVADSDGKLIQFIEKPPFAVVAEVAVEKGDGAIVMNIFFLLADKSTVVNLFVKIFHTVRNKLTGVRIGMEAVSVFATVLGGATSEKSTGDPRTEETRKFVSEEGVRLIGISYGGAGAEGGDIGNLDLNAEEFRAVVDSDLPMSERLDPERNKIPSNVVIYYEGAPLTGGPVDPKFILRNVRIIVPPTGTYTLRLGKGSAIVNSDIVFSEGNPYLTLTEGTIVIDSVIAAPVKLHGKNVVLQSVFHYGVQETENLDRPQTMDLNRDGGRVLAEWVPVKVLDAYEGETAVTIFYTGDNNAYVHRSFGDYKASVDTVAKTTFPGINIPQDSLWRAHPLIFGVGEIKGNSQYDMPLFRGKTFEDAKALIDAVKTRGMHLHVRDSSRFSSSVIIYPNLVTVRSFPGLRGKQGGFVDLAVLGQFFRNRWVLNLLLFGVLSLFSTALLASPAVSLDLAASAAGWDWASVGLFGTLGAGAAGAVYSAIFGISGPGEEKSLFEQTGRTPFGDNLVPAVGRQLEDLKARTGDLNSVYLESKATYSKLEQRKLALTDEEYTQIQMKRLTGETIVGTIESGRAAALLQPDRLNQGAAQLADAVGEKASSSARAIIADHSVRGALLTGLARNQGVSEKIVQAFNAFVDALFKSADKSNKTKEALSMLTGLAYSKTVHAVLVDQIEPGTISAWHLDETSDRAMIQNALDMAKRYTTEAGRGVLRERKAAFAITLAPGLAEGTNGDLVAELLALRDKVSALQVPILIHAPADGDTIVTQSEAGLVVHVSNILTRLGMNPGSLASGVKVQLVASPTSTVSFNKDGLSVNAVVEKILWLLEGIGLRVSSEDTEKEMHSLIAALKAA